MAAEDEDEQIPSHAVHKESTKAATASSHQRRRPVFCQRRRPSNPPNIQTRSIGSKFTMRP